MRLIFAVLFLLTLPATGIAEDDSAPIRAKPLLYFDIADSGKVRFGNLTYAGGLVLYSSNRHFGGLSAMRVSKDDEVLAVTDSGFWYFATIKRNQDGSPVGFENSSLSPILDEDGKPFLSKWSVDAEGLAIGDKHIFVSAEQFGRVLQFDRQDDQHKAKSKIIVSEFPGGQLRGSFGLEALAIVPSVPGGQPNGGTLLALSEGSTNEDGNLRGFFIAGEVIDTLSVKRSDGYSITDAAFLPGGDLLILERRFTLGQGSQARIRQISKAAIVPGAVLDGTTIFEANRHQQIDNMEGISVFKDKAGKTRIALISDNNHWLLQRTIYLEFIYGEGE